MLGQPEPDIFHRTCYRWNIDFRLCPHCFFCACVCVCVCACCFFGSKRREMICIYVFNTLITNKFALAYAKCGPRRLRTNQIRAKGSVRADAVRIASVLRQSRVSVYMRLAPGCGSSVCSSAQGAPRHKIHVRRSPMPRGTAHAEQ